MSRVSSGMGNSSSSPFTPTSRSGRRRKARAQFRRFPTTLTACVGTLKKCSFVGVFSAMQGTGEFAPARRSGQSGNTCGFNLATLYPPQVERKPQEKSEYAAEPRSGQSGGPLRCPNRQQEGRARQALVVLPAAL